MGLQRDAALFGALFAGSGPGALFARNTYESEEPSPSAGITVVDESIIESPESDGLFP